ncbi:MAG: carboxypeptidase-like regulatory domain-containing protein [Candidatus Sulfotelmatobacter sp.]
MSWRKWTLWAMVAVAVGAVAVVLVVRSHRWRPRTITLQGAVIRKDADVRKELPIANVEVVATDGLMTARTQSEASGYFTLTFRENVWPGQTVTLSFRSPDYESYDLTLRPGIRSTTQKLYIAKLTPIHPEAPPHSPKKASVVSNIRIRYTVNSRGDLNIGSAVRTFQVVNRGNVPCNRQAPCSPDGLWKAATGSVTMDAGPDHEYRNVRASCIAGACPFTRIDSSGYSQGGRVITATALDWSDTATFLLEAEVFRTSINSNVRESYPVIFGQTLNFTLPPTEEGVSIEADLDGTSMVFPLGPDLSLSWATCSSRNNREGEHSTVYRCELKPGYQFKDHQNLDSTAMTASTPGI